MSKNRQEWYEIARRIQTRTVYDWYASVVIRAALDRNLKAHAECLKSHTCLKCQTGYCDCCSWGLELSQRSTGGLENCLLCDETETSTFTQPCFKSIIWAQCPIARLLLYPDYPSEPISNRPGSILSFVNGHEVYLDSEFNSGFYIPLMTDSYLAVVMEHLVDIPTASQNILHQPTVHTIEHIMRVTWSFTIEARCDQETTQKAKKVVKECLNCTGMPRELVELVDCFIVVYATHEIPVRKPGAPQFVTYLFHRPWIHRGDYY